MRITNFITGRGASTHRRITFIHAAMFVFGFSIVFIALGASLGIIGFALQENIIWFQRVAGVALVILGLHLAEIITLPFLMRTYQIRSHETRSTFQPGRGRIRRYSRSLFIGGAFSLGWTPCIGPILAGILTLAADSGSVLQGTILLFFYALGLGLPFLIVGSALGSSTAVLRRITPHLSLLSILSGILLVFIGVLIFLDRIVVLNELFKFSSGISENVSTSEESMTGTFGFVVAFVGGFLSFLSPCVLPLVPIYLGHLVGVSAEEVEVNSSSASAR